MGFISPLAFIFGFSIILSRVFKRKFEEVLPLSLITPTLIVYVYGLFDNFSVIIEFIYYICLIAIVLELFISIKNREVNTQLFTPILFLFIFMYSFIYILNLNRMFSSWDEFSHWGPMVKEMLRLDTFYAVPQSTLFLHKNYPPIVSLFETIWSFIIGGYKEGYLYRSLQILSFSFFFPGFKSLRLKWNLRSFLKGLIVTLIILMINIVIPLEDAHFYRNIYIDSLLAVSFAYGLYLVYEFEWTLFDWIQITLVLGFIFLVKQMGIVFVLIIMGNLFLKILFYKNKNYKHFILFGFVVIGSLLFQFSWSQYISPLNINSQFSISNIDLGTLLGVARGESGELFQIATFWNFVNALNEKTLLSIGLNFNFYGMFALFTGLFSVLVLISEDNRRNIGIIGALFIFGSFAYAFILLLLYIYNFGYYEGPILASFVRYVNTYWYAGLILWWFIFLLIVSKKSQKCTTWGLSIVLVILVTNLTVQGKWGELKPVLVAESSVQKYYDDIDIIKSNTDGKSSVFIVAQRSTGFVTNVVRYYTMPQWINTWYYSLGEPYYEGDVWTSNLSIQEWSSLLEGYKFVYLYEVDQKFRNSFYPLFEPESYPDNKQLFEVIYQETGLVYLNRIY